MHVHLEKNPYSPSSTVSDTVFLTMGPKKNRSHYPFINMLKVVFIHVIHYGSGVYIQPPGSYNLWTVRLDSLQYVLPGPSVAKEPENMVK